MTKVEEIARLLCEQDGRDPDLCSVMINGKPASEPYWTNYIDKAIAIIDALATTP